MREWLALELTPRGESEDPDQVKKSLSHSLKGAEVFIPVAVTKIEESKAVHFLMEGYAFVQLDRSRPISDYFRLEGTKYVQSLLRTGSTDRHKKPAVIPDKDIVRMKAQIRKLVDQGISVGDQVTITSGPYKNITAIVIEDIPENDMVQVLIKLRSQESLVMLPRSFLVVQERTQYSALNSELTSLYDWVLLASPVLKWTANITEIQKSYVDLQQVVRWSKKGKDLYDLVTFDTAFKPELDILKSKSAYLKKVSKWDIQLSNLTPFVGFYQNYLTASSLGSLTKTLEELTCVDNLLTRIKTLWEDLEAISKTQARKQEGKRMVQNVIVDGHNLAFRCFHAPGIKNLADSKGRPTGVLTGFLRSLGSLKKRFPEATIYVTWDGSSRRRKAKYGDYKGNRPVRTEMAESYSPIQTLTEVLPLLGVRQAWNPEEEADDVMATLTRGPLAKQTNVVFSTDKDLLQLVTQTTSVLIPAIGSRNEILFNPSGVEKTMGVAPDRMVQLRAFYGDTSDNIPGVPRVPKKILRSLVQAYGSVDGVYGSGLMGVSKGQYERLRSSEPQVRINIELLNLVDVEIHHTMSDADPEIAARILKDFDINPDPLLETFFGQTA